MKINFPNGEYLIVSGSNFSYSSGSEKLMEELAAFLRSRGVRPEIERIGPLHNGPFRINNEINFTNLDILKFACFMEKRVAC